ncbi:MAG: TetR/AcrR family transcriptional regulator [Acutalibacteraceae bacterium]|nr:TetR/AcrR family transcriptional regulator [Acutalibacteraceae bacterium]
MREDREHKNHKDNVIEVAEDLFSKNGYGKTTVSEIIDKVNIAKGTFYYYFQSKEEVLDCIVEKRVNSLLKKVNEVKSANNLTLPEKIVGIIQSQKLESTEERKILEEIYRPENSLMHQKIRNRLIETLAPILAEIVIEGNERGIFKAEYPLEYMEILLSATVVLTDRNWKFNDNNNVIQALFSALELMLHADKGCFSFAVDNLFLDNRFNKEKKRNDV